MVSKDLLNEETVSISIQILYLRSLNLSIPDGKDVDWVWDHGQDASITLPGKFVQQINPDIMNIGEEIGE